MLKEKSIEIINKYPRKELVELLSVTEKTLYRWANGETEPNLTQFEMLCEKDRTDNTDSVFFKKMFGNSKESTHAIASTSNDTVAVPFYGNVPVSAGGGAVVLDEGITDYLPFDKAWVERKIGISKGLTAFPVVGDSMYPTYKTGDTVICVDVKDDYMGDGIYIVSLDGVVMIKRLNRTPQGIMHIISDNPLNKDYEINLKEENLNFKIIAMVKMTLALN